LRSLTNGLPSRTNVCSRRKRTCGPQGGSPGLWRVSDDGCSRWFGWHRGRRPKASKEGTRGKWSAAAACALWRFDWSDDGRRATGSAGQV